MTAAENPFGELLQDYIVECLPLAEEVADAFVDLERQWHAGEPGDHLLASVKGRLHTVKGNSAMMGLRPMQDLAHAILVMRIAKKRNEVHVECRALNNLPHLALDLV